MGALTSILEGSSPMCPVLAIPASVTPLVEELRDDVTGITGAGAGEGLAHEAAGGSPEEIVWS